MNGALPPSAANQHGSESTHPNDPTFQVGGVEFAAFRVPDPRVPDKQWWALRVVENGKVFDPRDGSSHEHSSVPKLQASIEDAFARLYENDPDLLRRSYGLPPRLERIRAVCAKAKVEVGHYDDPHAPDGRMWYYRTGAREEVAFRDEAFTGLCGLRDSPVLQDFLLASKQYVREDDTLLVVHAERWLDKHALRAAEEPTRGETGEKPMTRLIDLQRQFELVPGDSLDSPRFRFKSGFHDGTETESAGRQTPWDPRMHFDPVYVAGYFAGREDFRCSGQRSESSESAWNLHLSGDFSNRAYLFIVSTSGEMDDMELHGATISDGDLGALLHYDEVAVEDRQGDGVVYARNQDGMLIELTLDMDQQTPIVRPVFLTPAGVVDRSPCDGLAEESGMRP